MESMSEQLRELAEHKSRMKTDDKGTHSKYTTKKLLPEMGLHSLGKPC